MISIKSTRAFVRPLLFASALILPLSGALAAGIDGSAQQQARALLFPAAPSAGVGTMPRDHAVTRVVHLDAQEQARGLLVGRQTPAAKSSESRQLGHRQVQADAQERAQRLLIGSNNSKFPMTYGSRLR